MGSISIDYRWFSLPYSTVTKEKMTAGLKGLCADSLLPCEQQVLMILCKSLLHYEPDLAAIPAQDFSKVVLSLKTMERHDMVVLALIMALCCKQNSQQRLAKLLEGWCDGFQVQEKIRSVLQLLYENNIKKICSSKVLQIGYQNTISQIKGLNTLGHKLFKRQMMGMKKGEKVLELKRKFEFMNDLPANTLGGSLRDLLRKGMLSLPGDPYGFPEFFLWHDIAHLLSGNNQKFDGELGANAFTAGFSKKAAYDILLFGLLQWNFGVRLAVVAAPASDYLLKPGVLEKYCESLLLGAETTLDLLDWPVADMIEDLKQDLDVVRRKYNIQLRSPDLSML